jgi:hypothetical protein
MVSKGPRSVWFDKEYRHVTSQGKLYREMLDLQTNLHEDALSREAAFNETHRVSL